MNLELGNKIALVFGGSKGIGLAIAKGLANEGSGICIVSRSLENLNSAQASIGPLASGSVTIFQADAGNVDDLSALYDFLLNGIGLPDIVINNSGGPSSGTFMDLDESAWMAAFEQHLMSPVRLMKKFSPSMIEKKWGRFINVSSTVAIEPSSLMCISATMRSGVAALSKSASLTLAKTGITINTICPGGVTTERLLDLLETRSKNEGIPVAKLLDDGQKSIPMNRFASPDEIADLTIFLSSTRANYITGRVHSIDGGLTASF